MCYCDQVIGCTTYTNGSIPDECTDCLRHDDQAKLWDWPNLPVEQLKKHLCFSHTT